MARSFRDADWETLETLRKIEAEIHRAEQLGGTFSCESASDLLEIARHLRLFGISNRHDALLTYYCHRTLLARDILPTLGATYGGER